MKASTFFAIGLIALGLIARFGANAPKPAPRPDRPSDAVAAAVAPVATILKGHAEDGAKLAGFYAALADVVTRDQGKVIETTAQLRELHRRAGLLMFQRTGIEGKYPGLAEAIDKVLADRIGLDNVKMDVTKQTAAVEAFHALAWACAGGG
jgi:hypothetical protein